MITTIKAKILAGSGLLILIGFGVLAGANIYNSYRNAEAAVLDHARLLAKSEAGRVQRKLGQTYDSAQAMAEAALAVKSAMPPNGRSLLSEVVKRQLPNNPDAVGYWVDWEPNAFDGRDAELAGKPENDSTGRYGVYWVRKGGKVDVVWGGDGVDSSPYYAEPRRSGKPTLTEPYIDPDVKILMGTVSFPLSLGGKVLGVAGCDIALGHLQKLAEQVRPYGSGYMSLYSNGGMQLAGWQPGFNGKPAQDLPAEAKDAIREGKPDEYRGDDGFRHFIMPIAVGQADKPWAVRISIPENEAFAPVRAASWQAAGISLAILALILLLLGATLSQLLRPLGRLQGAMTELAAGDGDLTRELAIASRDEIGQAAGAFNAFIGSLRAMMLDVRRHAGDVLGSVRQLSGDVASIRDSSARQSQAATATAASVEQLSVSVSHIAESARVAELRAREADTLSGRAAADVEATAAEINRIAGSVRQLAEVLSGMRQRSDQISGIVLVIRDIADQTNLLALNAAIEAARAGEQGRGFAVVADEVRKLAERTAQATLEIGGVIQTMQRDTADASGSMDGALGQVERGVRLAAESSQSIRQISGQAQEVMTAVGDIAASTAEQSSASQEIARHIENIHGMLLQTDDSIHQAQQATEGLARLGEELEGLIGRFQL